MIIDFEMMEESSYSFENHENDYQFVYLTNKY